MNLLMLLKTNLLRGASDGTPGGSSGGGGGTGGAGRGKSRLGGRWLKDEFIPPGLQRQNILDGKTEENS